MSLENESDTQFPFVSSVNVWTDTNQCMSLALVVTSSLNKIATKNCTWTGILPNKCNNILLMSFAPQTSWIAHARACCSRNQLTLSLACGFHFACRFCLKDIRMYKNRSILQYLQWQSLGLSLPELPDRRGCDAESADTWRERDIIGLARPTIKWWEWHGN